MKMCADPSNNKPNAVMVLKLLIKQNMDQLDTLQNLLLRCGDNTVQAISDAAASTAEANDAIAEAEELCFPPLTTSPFSTVSPVSNTATNNGSNSKRKAAAPPDVRGKKRSNSAKTNPASNTATNNGNNGSNASSKRGKKRSNSVKTKPASNTATNNGNNGSNASSKRGKKRSNSAKTSGSKSTVKVEAAQAPAPVPSVKGEAAQAPAPVPFGLQTVKREAAQAPAPVPFGLQTTQRQQEFKNITINHKGVQKEYPQLQYQAGIRTTCPSCWSNLNALADEFYGQKNAIFECPECGAFLCYETTKSVGDCFLAEVPVEDYDKTTSNVTNEHEVESDFEDLEDDVIRKVSTWSCVCMLFARFTCCCTFCMLFVRFACCLHVLHVCTFCMLFACY